MPRDDSQNWSIGDQILASRLQAFNTEIDKILTHWSDKWRVVAAASASALKVDIAAFSFIVWAIKWIYAGTTDFSVTDNSINYIEINDSWVVASNTIGWTATKARIWKVTASGWIITAIEDWRPDVVGGELGGVSYDSVVATRLNTATPTTITYNHNLWVIPKKIEVTAWVAWVSIDWFWSTGSRLPGDDNKCMYSLYSIEGADTTYSIRTDKSGTSWQNGIIQNVTSTTFDVVWSWWWWLADVFWIHFDLFA